MGVFDTGVAISRKKRFSLVVTKSQTTQSHVVGYPHHIPIDSRENGWFYSPAQLHPFSRISPTTMTFSEPSYDHHIPMVSPWFPHGFSMFRPFWIHQEALERLRAQLGISHEALNPRMLISNYVPFYPHGCFTSLIIYSIHIYIYKY
jgi:hypothetical protein